MEAEEASGHLEVVLIETSAQLDKGKQATYKDQQ